MYFEFTSPYYAIIRAHSGAEARSVFARDICPADEESGEEYDYKVLTHAEALATYALCSTGQEAYEGNLIEQRKALQKDFNETAYGTTLIVDRDLV